MLDPELQAVAPPAAQLSPEAIGPTRASLAQRRREVAEGTDTTGVVISSSAAAGVPVRIYRGGGSPAVIYCHAGAFVLGNLDTDHRQCVELARRARCCVVSVGYRLAPEHPYPAALEDARSVLEWVVAEAAQLGIDPTRLAVAGSSAGAALAACLAQRAADGSAPSVVFQLLHQPALDDRPSVSKSACVATPAFDGAAADLMWRHYLGGTAGSPDAVPGRRERLAGAPAAFISCSDIDPLRDEAIDYARALLSAGVATELHVFPGTCHGFDSLLPEWEVSQRLFELQGTALRRVFSSV